ncbi:glycine--tRNA ligase subunit beta [Alkalibacterium iburiense]|uniref:Glycine--tRNA ligase beta subunit n=1 Tax=Alkalibacterium iburiense TaxID=290589 RepID=A0ABP3HJS4_9LACT
MSHTFLLEIGLEEMPAKVISSAVKELKERVSAHFNENNLTYESIRAYSTPRRLALIVTDLADKQPDKTETVRGPAKRIALDDEGQWTKAAIGFTKGQKASVDDIIFKEVKGEEYVFVEKHIKGQTAPEVISELSPVLASIPFPVSMKWGNHSFKYIRPVHWLVALLDDQVVSLDLFDISSSNQTKGHRFLGETITLTHAADYVSALKEQQVIVDREERKQLIIDQIEALCEANNWKSPLSNESLLNEVTDLVEYPTAFYGSFHTDYLSVPEMVLETAMADHQRYFPVRENDADASFLPHFIAVRNGNDEAIDHVRKGNEKVLEARLADADFFYEEDKKLSIKDFVEKLPTVSFHEKLGSLYDKQKRIEHLSVLLAPYFSVSNEQLSDLKRAAMIAKFDLVTQTVNEFTSLQGQIGGIFAKERGENEAVSQAISEHYLPVSMEGSLPETVEGAILSLADKMDSLLSFFSIDLIPSGSNDPFALRRQAMGIVRIIEAFNVHVPLNEWIDAIISETESIETKALYEQKKDSVIQFIKDRVDQWLSKEAGLSKDHDIRAAVLGSDQDDLIQLIAIARVLKEEKAKDSFKPIVESLTRVSNLAEKADEELDVSPELFESDSEKALYEAVVESETQLKAETSAFSYWTVLSNLHEVIDTFFDNNMVMSDNEKVRANRLALLKRINDMTLPFAHFDALVIK